MEELEKRLVGRGTETEESLSKRLYKVKFEMAFQDQFDVVLLNDDLETSYVKTKKLYEDFCNNKVSLEVKPVFI
jgi:guanylate kinase